MKKQSGFTLIELLIVIAIIGILASIFYNGHLGKGYTCRGGYQFAYNGHQIIGANGGGIPCND